ncbi:MAG: membrane protein insertase YidC [Deltaproteobacteria bacterium]|nr:membrane protein insertase YidC [Deltaproteobacteria bacterium]
MEQVRLLLAIGLSFLVFLVWQFFFTEKKTDQPVEPPKTVEQTKEAPVKEKVSVPEKKPDIEKQLIDEKETTEEDAHKSRSIRVNTPLYSVVVSEKGAAFKSFTLQNYRKEIDKTSEPFEMISSDVSPGTVLSGFENNSIRGLEDRLFTVDAKYDSIDVKAQKREVVFIYRSQDGILVEKKYVFYADSYVIGMMVSIKNGSNSPIKDNLSLSLMNLTSDDKRMYGFEGPSAMIGDSIEKVKPKKVKDKNIFSGDLKWIAIQDRYFISSIIPKEPVDATMKATMKLDIDENGVLMNRYVSNEMVIQPGNEKLFEYELYFGPKSIQVLKGVGHNLDRAVDFGWFDFLAKPCLWIMNLLYSVIPNYGVAIIILTIFTKIILWPLGTKSYKSMNAMKKLQPLMTEIREKFKDDKKKMNEELMGLYKTYKINPLGGCLPMVVQMPVFFALYRMLYGAIELRHAPFFGWINDLSAPDRLFDFGFSIPFMEPPYGIPVLTIIMGASMLLSQKMQPPAGDPAQAKMMMLMPVVFTFIFINFSSGLVLYWLVNNILSIAQQYYTQKKHA